MILESATLEATKEDGSEAQEGEPRGVRVSDHTRGGCACPAAAKHTYHDQILGPCKCPGF